MPYGPYSKKAFFWVCDVVALKPINLATETMRNSVYSIWASLLTESLRADKHMSLICRKPDLRSQLSIKF